MDYYGYFAQLARSIRGLTSIEAAVLLREVYDKLHGISNPSDTSRPLSIVEERPKDGLHELGPLYYRIWEHRHYEVYKNYGLALDNFLMLPRHIVEHILSGLRREKQQEIELKQQLQQQMERDGKLPPIRD